MRIASESTAKLTIQRSRFLAVLFPAKSEKDVKAMLAVRRKEIKKARHHCWAARFESEPGEVVELARDDGEVGRPGQKMLEVMRKKDIRGALVVSRIFGGVKLGPAGVGRAFRDVALEVVETAVTAGR